MSNIGKSGIPDLKSGSMKQKSRVSKKISLLRSEGVPERQSVAEALSMQRAGRVTKSGGYRHVRKSRRK